MLLPGFYMLVVFTNLLIFNLASLIFSNRQLHLFLDETFILDLTIFPLYINDVPDDVICNISIYTEGTTCYSKCDQTLIRGHSLS